MSAKELAALIVQHYVDYYTTHPLVLNRSDVTKVALDLARSAELTQAVDALNVVLLADVEGQSEYLWAAQRETQVAEALQGQRWNDKFNYHLWNIGTLAAYLVSHSTDAAVRSAAREVTVALNPGGAVIAEGHCGEWFDGIGGVSIYALPPLVQRISPYYAKVTLAQDTCWGEMLQAYHAAL